MDVTLLEEKEEIKEGIAGFYDRIYCDSGGWHPRLDGMHFNSLEYDDMIVLERAFSEDEVVLALRSLSGDKAPGPDRRAHPVITAGYG